MPTTPPPTVPLPTGTVPPIFRDSAVVITIPEQTAATVRWFECGLHVYMCACVHVHACVHVCVCVCACMCSCVRVCVVYVYVVLRRV